MTRNGSALESTVMNVVLGSQFIHILDGPPVLVCNIQGWHSIQCTFYLSVFISAFTTQQNIMLD